MSLNSDFTKFLPGEIGGVAKTLQEMPEGSATSVVTSNDSGDSMHSGTI